MPAILFICTANQIRSPFAEAVMRQNLIELGLSSQYSVSSAGTWTKSGLSIEPDFMQLMTAVGADVHGFRTTSVEDVKLSDFDFILVMEKSHLEALRYEHPKAAERIQLLTTAVGEYPSDIPDPTQIDIDSILLVLEDLRRLVMRLAQQLAASGIPSTLS